MHVKRQQTDDTKLNLEIVADESILNQIKAATLKDLSGNVTVPGFRPSKAPAALVEKHLNQSLLQNEFLERAVNHLYTEAIQHEKLRPVAQPEISITKFVPFTTLEFTAALETVGPISLPDYKKIKLELSETSVTAKDVNQVIDNLRARAATKKTVARAAKLGDEVSIDFAGTDPKTKAPIDGADGRDYPLLLGSRSFIPGFEEHLVGLKAGGQTKFALTFPKDYGVSTLRNQKVEFAVTVHEVREVNKAPLDDSFAQSAGPFQTVEQLKKDIKKQLTAEQERQNRRAYDNQLVEKIAAQTKAAIPRALIEEEIDRVEIEEKQNVVQQGQTWQEHLEAEALTAEAHREKQRPYAELRVKGGLILAEIAEREKITVSAEELEAQLQLLKAQYQDTAMQAELDKPENRREIYNRLLAQKTLDKLRSYSAKTA